MIFQQKEGSLDVMDCVVAWSLLILESWFVGDDVILVLVSDGIYHDLFIGDINLFTDDEHDVICSLKMRISSLVH